MGGCPEHFLVCDNTDYQISKYPDLANYFLANFGKKNYFGGNGTTTFRCPDLRGEFLRGTGTNSHTNQGSGANVGVHQDATSIKWWYVNNSSNVELTGNGEYGVGNADSTIPASSRHAVALSGSSSSVSAGYADGRTVRPTNTSVLYCISAVKLI